MLKNNCYHVKVLPSSFHLNGHTMRFCSQTEKLEPPYTAYKRYQRKVLNGSFHLNPQTEKGSIEVFG